MMKFNIITTLNFVIKNKLAKLEFKIIYLHIMLTCVYTYVYVCVYLNRLRSGYMAQSLLETRLDPSGTHWHCLQYTYIKAFFNVYVRLLIALRLGVACMNTCVLRYI